MNAGENGNNSRASRKQAGPLLKTSSVDPQSVYGTAAGCNRKMNNPARVVAMNGGEITEEVGEAPAMGCYVRLTLVAISVLCILPISVLSLIYGQDVDHRIARINTIKQSKVTYSVSPRIWRVSTQFLDIVSEKRLFSNLRVDK